MNDELERRGLKGCVDKTKRETMANCAMSMFLQLVVVRFPSRGHASARTVMRMVRRTGREIVLACGIVVCECRGALD